MRVATLPRPHEAAAPIVSASAPSGTAGARAGGDQPDAGQRERAAGELRAARALAEQQHREPDRERRLQLQHERREPGRHARVACPSEQQAELAGGEEDADRDRRSGRGRRGAARTGARARRAQKRSAAKSSGGKCSRPTWMTTKLTPQTTATASGDERHGGGACRQTVTALTRKSDWTFWM